MLIKWLELERVKAQMENIKKACAETWGGQCKMYEPIEYPHPQGKIRIDLLIYNRFDIILDWEGGWMGIFIPKEFGIKHEMPKGFDWMLMKDYTALERMTKKSLMNRDATTEPEGLLHNFQILDEVLREMM